MNAPAVRPSDLPAPSLVPVQGWHCTHMFYRIDRGAWANLTPDQRAQGLATMAATLDPKGADAPARFAELCRQWT